jgi:hypothetical protein
MNETESEEGDNMLTIFYRQQSIQSGATPFDELKFMVFDNTKSWDILNHTVVALSADKRVISVVHSPKNIGRTNT